MPLALRYNGRCDLPSERLRKRTRDVGRRIALRALHIDELAACLLQHEDSAGVATQVLGSNHRHGEVRGKQGWQLSAFTCRRKQLLPVAHVVGTTLNENGNRLILQTLLEFVQDAEIATALTGLRTVGGFRD